MRMTMRRLALPWLAVAAAGLLAAALRYGLIESPPIGQLCESAHAPGWCVPRQWLVLGFLHGIYGLLALALATLTLVLRRRWIASLAAAVGAFALVLYCFETGALALIVGALALLRMQAMEHAGAPPREQHRHRQRGIQAEP